MVDSTAHPEGLIEKTGFVEEIADVAIFLAGNKASLVVGANWAVVGGLLAEWT